ncbi:MAG: hypothetical protein QOH39_3406 [Verrucomicrobiota bacterium]|jgi:hypothetical protein
MERHQKLFTPSEVKALSDRLSQVPSVTRFDTPGDSQAAEIAHAMSGFEDSFSVVLDDLLPKLAHSENASPEELDEILLNIGEEMRHILYHIRATRYFGYLDDCWSGTLGPEPNRGKTQEGKSGQI